MNTFILYCAQLLANRVFSSYHPVGDIETGFYQFQENKTFNLPYTLSDIFIQK
jgi:hypothetical protein